MRALKTGEECLEGEPVIVTSLECSSTRVRAWVKPPSAVAGRGWGSKLTTWPGSVAGADVEGGR